MANTYTQIHIQCVIAVKFREAVIEQIWKERLHQYIIGIVQNNGHKMIAINSMPDHLHLFFGFRPNQSLSDLMRIVKGDSSEWINKERFTKSMFRWQEGYGAFSYARSQIKVVAEYLENQEEHHRKKTFLEDIKISLICLKWNIMPNIFLSLWNNLFDKYRPYGAKNLRLLFPLTY